MLRKTRANAGQAPEVKGLCLHPTARTGKIDLHRDIDELLGTLGRARSTCSPLVTILSAVQVITYECDIVPVARRALAVMERQSRQAMRLVEDLFDLCAGGLGKLSLHKEVVGLAGRSRCGGDGNQPVTYSPARGGTS